MVIIATGEKLQESTGIRRGRVYPVVKNCLVKLHRFGAISVSLHFSFTYLLTS